MSVAFRRESDEEHLEPKFERPLPAGPNLVTRAGLALIEARIAALADRDDDASKRDLRYWQTRRTTAQLTPAPADGTAGFGTRVTLTMAGKTRTVALVGDDEADPAADRIAFGAPLARALLGAEAGETVDWGGRRGAIEVIAVEAIDEPSPASEHG